MKNERLGIGVAAAGILAAVAHAAGHAPEAIAPNELRIGEGTGQSVKPLNGLGGGPKTGWGVGKDGGIYSDSTPLYGKIAPPFVRFHDIEAPFGRGQFFDVHIYMADKTSGHARFFEMSDAYVDTILAVAPQAKIIYRLGESIGASDDINPYAVRPADYAAWCTAAVEIAGHYVEKYKTVEWYFEIWNEANLTGNGCHTTFSSAPNAGDTCPASDYFKLYEQLALALGELRRNGDHRNMKIGGPAESGIEKGDYSTFSCEEFLAELERYNAEHGCIVPLDFYSWHQYDGPTIVQPVADQVGRHLAATTHYRKTLNICDEWNLSVDKTKLRKIGLAEGAANTLATMIAWQDSALDAAVYYDSQLSGGFNGLWYKPYLEAMISNEQFIQEFTTAYRERGEAGITEAQRRFLASSADQPLVTLGGYWAMRAFTAVAAHGETLRMERGPAVPASVYALASRDKSGGAVAIVNNAATPADIRVSAIPFPAPVSLTRVKGSSTPGAEVTPSVSAVDVSASFIDLTLDPYEIVLLGTGEGLR